MGGVGDGTGLGDLDCCLVPDELASFGGGSVSQTYPEGGAGVAFATAVAIVLNGEEGV